MPRVFFIHCKYGYRMKRIVMKLRHSENKYEITVIFFSWSILNYNCHRYHFRRPQEAEIWFKNDTNQLYLSIISLIHYANDNENVVLVTAMTRITPSGNVNWPMNTQDSAEHVRQNIQCAKTVCDEPRIVRQPLRRTRYIKAKRKVISIFWCDNQAVSRDENLIYACMTARHICR